MDTYIKLAAKNLTHNKKRSILLSVVVVCCITFFLLATYFLRLTDGYFRFQERYDINARSFTVSPVETVEINREEEEYRIRYREIRQELLEMPHIETAFSSLGYSLGIKNAIAGGQEIHPELYGADHKTPLYIESGRKLKENERNAVLIPSGITPPLSLGEEIRICIDESAEYSCKVVGIYDDFMETGRWYLPVQDVEDLNYIQRENAIEKGYTKSRGRLAFTVIADDFRNMARLQKLLAEHRYLIGEQYYESSETNVKDFFSAVSFTVATALTAIVVVSAIYISCKNVNERNCEIGILKAIGYTNRRIRLSFLFEFFILGGIAYGISAAASIPLIYLLKNYMNRRLKPIFVHLDVPGADLYGLALLGIVVALYLSVFISLQKINRISTADVLKA